jgi:hypothetical protein
MRTHRGGTLTPVQIKWRSSAEPNTVALRFLGDEMDDQLWKIVLVNLVGWAVLIGCFVLMRRWATSAL